MWKKSNERCQIFLGTHDFTSFCATGSSVDDKTRTIHEASMAVNDAGDELIFTFRGDGFLYKMIRIMVGTLLKIGNGHSHLTVFLRSLRKKTEMQQVPQLIQKDCIWFTLPMNKKKHKLRCSCPKRRKRKLVFLFFLRQNRGSFLPIFSPFRSGFRRSSGGCFF
ncbi:MAG: hypothetical protein ACLSIL_09730 [Enterococcus casseliflavus]